MNKRITIVVACGAALLMAGCGASTTTSNTGTTSSGQAQGAVSPSPIKQDKDSQLACDSARREIRPAGEALTSVGKGTATVEDALGPIKKTAGSLSDDASFAHGDVQTSLQQLSDDLARLRVALSNGDTANATTLAGTVNTDMTRPTPPARRLVTERVGSLLHHRTNADGLRGIRMTTPSGESPSVHPSELPSPIATTSVVSTTAPPTGTAVGAPPVPAPKVPDQPHTQVPTAPITKTTTPVPPQVAASVAATFANCAALRAVYPHGVGCRGLWTTSRAVPSR